MPRIMISCPSGRGDVPTGYRTADIDLSTRSHIRSFRCCCGSVHSWSEDDAWAEAGFPAGERRSLGRELVSEDAAGSPGGDR